MTDTEWTGSDVPEPDDAPPVRPRTRRRGRHACMFGILVGLGGLITGRAGALWIVLDVFAQFTPQFALLTLSFAIGLFMPRARVLIACVLLIAGIVGWGLWPHLASAGENPPLQAGANERALRLMSFNTWFRNSDVDAVTNEIERQDPDIAVLIEFGPEKRAVLDRLKTRYLYQEDCLHLDYCYMAIISKFPIKDFESHVRWDGPPVLRATFGPELGNLTVIGVHSIRFPHMRAQLAQMRELASFAGQFGGPRVVMGDFNATPFSRLLGTFRSLSGLSRISNLPTFPARTQLPQLAIDHLFLSRQVRLLAPERIGSNAGSDHFPIIGDVAVSTE
ncbi:endonuclease/exonuclease/phosphatase family protein [soil metagenome]